MKPIYSHTSALRPVVKELLVDISEVSSCHHMTMS